ncbi:MAG TPA: SGNH/GDSL hydrolase family protein [Myxococcota bacterium]|nr:SGNH/GDSL hydrolase family protein [Myxococcota bacterium]
MSSGSSNLRASASDSTRARLLNNILLALAMFIGLDVLVSLVFCREGHFFGTTLPPYDLLFTDEQRSRLAKLGEDPSDRPGLLDPDLGWSHRANYTGPGGPTNSAAIRANREYTRDVPSGITRVAAFGDSFTHSGPIPRIEDTWTYRLEQSRPNLEVLNFGVSGYGTDQAYLRYRRDGAPFHPNVVLIGLMTENMFRNVSVYRPAYYHRSGGIGVKPRFKVGAHGELQLLPCPARSAQELKALIESRDLVELLRDTDYWVQRAPLAYSSSPFFASSLFRISYAVYEHRRPLAAHYANTSSEPFQVTLAILRSFHDEALANGADRALVIAMPTEGDLSQLRLGKPRYWQTLLDALQARGVPVIDLADPLLAAIGEADVSDYFASFHYNAAADAIVAQALAERIF